MPTLRRSTLALLAALFAGPLAAPRAVAATVTASVTDKAGRALPGAVVMLEPVSGKLPVKPMSGIEIAQSKRKFVPDVTVVTLGTAVTFPNLDTVRHHVYSFSPAKTFELKLYAGTPSSAVVFDKTGIAAIGCNIHDQMAAWIVIVDTPHHARSGADGSARLEGVAAGSYRLRAWHPGLAVDAQPPSVTVKVAAADIEQAIRLDVAAAP
ncbi:MAG: methylamine utilization protein [Pseudomonadota bacterium]|nr:methylamine utilization protein [Pseudomonadota bacterium]